MGQLLAGLLAVAFGFACWAIGTFLAWRSVRRLRHHERALATVVRYIRRDERSYSPVLEYTTRDGERARAISWYGGSDKFWPIGTKVTITYDPTRPKKADVIAFGPLWLGPLVCTVFGVIFLRVGYLTLFVYEL